MKPSQWIEARSDKLNAEHDMGSDRAYIAAILQFLDSAHGDAVPSEPAPFPCPQWVSKEPAQPDVDPDIIRAAEGVVLGPGSYEGAAGGDHRFTLTKPLLATRRMGTWVFGYLSDMSVTAVRRVEAKAQPEAKCPVCKGSGKSYICGHSKRECPDRCKAPREIDRPCDDCKGTGRAKLGDPTCKADLQVAERPIVAGSIWRDNGLFARERMVIALNSNGEPTTDDVNHVEQPNPYTWSSAEEFRKSHTWLRDPAPTPSDVFRTLTPEEQAALPPVSETEIREALAQGARDVESVRNATRGGANLETPSDAPAERSARDLLLDAIEERYEHEPEQGDCDSFREALNDAYNAGLESAKETPSEARAHVVDVPLREHEVFEHLKWLADFSYKQGARELGYDPVSQARTMVERLTKERDEAIAKVAELERLNNNANDLLNMRQITEERQALRTIDALKSERDDALAKVKERRAETEAWSTIERWSRMPSLLDSCIQITPPFESEHRWHIEITSGTVFCSSHYGETREHALCVTAKWCEEELRLALAAGGKNG